MSSFFLNMPKVELHVHIEGAALPETYYALAQKNEIKLPVGSLEEWKDFFRFKDFPHFINVYGSAVSTLQKAEDYAFLVEHFFKHQKDQEIVYTEAFLSASHIIQHFSNDEILEALEYGLREGERKYNVKINLIPDISRHLPETQENVLELAIEGFQKGIFIGLGLGGLETGYPPSLFTDTFQKAKRAGLHVVAHAGEAAGAESIKEAINRLGIQRIGHGIRCLEDENLVSYLQETGLPLEVSPTSNYNLALLEPGAIHPVGEMVRQGLVCTINSDDPDMFSTTLSNEYQLLLSQGFTIDSLCYLNRNGINSSFLSEAEKRGLHEKMSLYESKYL